MAQTAAASAREIDAVKVDPAHYRLELENDTVRVLRVKFGPGEKSVAHTHPATVVVNLTEQHSHHGHHDGSHRAVKGQIGEVHYFDPCHHVSENKGDKPFELLMVEVKPSETGAPSKSAAGSRQIDAVEADPGHYKLELENDTVRVLRVKFGPGEKSVLHTHPATVVVNLTEQHSHHSHADGSHRAVKGKVGEVHYFEACEHISENKGDKAFELIMVEVKS